MHNKFEYNMETVKQAIANYQLCSFEVPKTLLANNEGVRVGRRRGPIIDPSIRAIRTTDTLALTEKYDKLVYEPKNDQWELSVRLFHADYFDNREQFDKFILADDEQTHTLAHAHVPIDQAFQLVCPRRLHVNANYFNTQSDQLETNKKYFYECMCDIFGEPQSDTDHDLQFMLTDFNLLYCDYESRYATAQRNQTYLYLFAMN